MKKKITNQNQTKSKATSKSDSLSKKSISNSYITKISSISKELEKKENNLKYNLHKLITIKYSLNNSLKELEQKEKKLTSDFTSFVEKNNFFENEENSKEDSELKNLIEKARNENQENKKFENEYFIYKKISEERENNLKNKFQKLNENEKNLFIILKKLIVNEEKLNTQEKNIIKNKRLLLFQSREGCKEKKREILMFEKERKMKKKIITKSKKKKLFRSNTNPLNFEHNGKYKEKKIRNSSKINDDNNDLSENRKSKTNNNSENKRKKDNYYINRNFSNIVELNKTFYLKVNSTYRDKWNKKENIFNKSINNEEEKKRIIKNKSCGNFSNNTKKLFLNSDRKIKIIQGNKNALNLQYLKNNIDIDNFDVLYQKRKEKRIKIKSNLINKLINTESKIES